MSRRCSVGVSGRRSAIAASRAVFFPYSSCKLFCVSVIGSKRRIRAGRELSEHL